MRGYFWNTIPGQIGEPTKILGTLCDTQEIQGELLYMNEKNEWANHFEAIDDGTSTYSN